MNRKIKLGVAVIMSAMLATAFAKEAETEEGSVGWTPVAFGLASPVQLPWGHAQWDVYGLDIGLLYYGAPKMYGLGVAGLGALTTEDTIGLEVGGLMNWCSKDVYGMRVSCGANIDMGGTVYGVEVGGFGFRQQMWGLDIEFIGSFQDNFTGWQTSGLVNIAKEQSYGFQSAIGLNMAKVAYGCQLAGVFNMAEELHGFQLGLVNFADECCWGLQIGIVNIIMSNQLKVLPFFNCYF